MADLANLVLAVDSTQVPKGTAALNDLAAAGARAEAATTGLSTGFKGAGAEAAAMASAAQLSARAAMDQAAGFRASTDAARLNTLAMRETLVVAREISRGNFTRLPGSLTLLAQGVGSQGGIGAYASAIANQLGLIKQVQNAELAEAAAAAASAAAGVEAAARRAAANVMAADTEIALAEAQVRVAEGATAEAAAHARLAAAHEAVAAAAAEATIAENALATAMGRSAEAGTASAAATRTVIGGTTVGLLGIAAVAGVAYGAVKEFQEQVKDDGTLTAYRDSLGLTHAEMLRLSDGVDTVGGHIKELGDVTVTYGDVWHGIWAEVGREASDGAPWNSLKNNALSAFDAILSGWNKVSAGITAGLWTIQNLLAGGAGAALGLAPGLVPQVNGGQTSLSANYNAALAQNKAAFGGVRSGAIASAEKRMRDQANALKADRRAKKGRNKKPNDHGLAEALAKLDAEIKGQYALAAAYGAGTAAAQRAEAAQKAAEDAISHKGGLDQFKALELQKIVATDVASQAKKNAALDVENSIRARLNGEVADGTLNIAAYNSQLKLQTTLNQLNADLENADAAHKQTVLNIIDETIRRENEQLQLESQLNALKSIAANDNEIARMRLENSLMGASNKERAVAIAQLEAMQQLKDIDPNGLLTRGERDNYVQSAINKAAAGVQTPFEQWAKGIPQTSAAITEALQGIETHGFDQLAQGIAGVVTGTESLGKAFKDVAQSIISDIIQMTVKMLIFRAISSIFGSIGGADIGAPMSTSFSGVASSLPGGLSASSVATIPHFAGGGSMIIGGNGGTDTNVISINGKPAAMGNTGETLAVFPSGKAANSNTPQHVEVFVHVATDENFNASVAQMAGQVVVQAAPTIVKSAVQATATTFTRKTLNGRR